VTHLWPEGLQNGLRLLVAHLQVLQGLQGPRGGRGRPRVPEADAPLREGGPEAVDERPQLALLGPVVPGLDLQGLLEALGALLGLQQETLQLLRGETHEGRQPEGAAAARPGSTAAHLQADPVDVGGAQDPDEGPQHRAHQRPVLGALRPRALLLVALADAG